ncbi:MAG: hypothetical protein ACE5HS_06675 [bacterium]
MNKNIQKLLFFFILIVPFGCFSCGHKNSPKGVAEAFLYRYFIELNQQGALELSSGLAEKKLQKEIKLLQSVRMEPNLDLSKHKPFIDYTLVSSKTHSDRSITFYYDVKIENKSGDESERKMVLSAVDVDGVWKVNNFDIFDGTNPN